MVRSPPNPMDNVHGDTDRLASEFLRHDNCEECGSSDAKSLYSDGHAFCFSCHTYFPSNGEVKKLTSTMSLQGEARTLRSRGLTEKTCQKYKIYRDGELLRHYYHSKDGVLLGCKVKTKDKDFWYEGDTDGSFFGQHLWPSTGKRIVITEGELDAASCSQVQPTWPMVSLPSGAASAKKAIQTNLELLQGYDEIVLFFDNDEPGRKAAKECADLLPPGKVSIAVLASYKDASEALQNNDQDALIRAIWDAKTPIDPMESSKDDPPLRNHHNNPPVTSPTESKDSTTYYMVQDTESLLRLLQAVEQASPHSAGTLQLHYYRMATGSVTWLLKNRIGALLSV